MKKLAIIGSVILLLIVVISALTIKERNDKLASHENPYNTKDLNPATIDLLDDENYQSIIMPDELEKKIASGEDTFAYFFSPTCQYCKAFTPVMMPIAEERGLAIHQLNLLEYEGAWNSYGIESTPTLIYFKEGKEVSRLIGDAPVERVHQFFDQVKK